MEPFGMLSNDNSESNPDTISTPSADYIHAISEFFDTDPSDLLAELGYYNRTTAQENPISSEFILAQE